GRPEGCAAPAGRASAGRPAGHRAHRRPAPPRADHVRPRGRPHRHGGRPQAQDVQRSPPAKEPRGQSCSQCARRPLRRRLGPPLVGPRRWQGARGPRGARLGASGRPSGREVPSLRGPPPGGPGDRHDRRPLDIVVGLPL
ncbi:MAG: FIG00666222: hypothetical protein, partial [uncultured Acidimicrobiales bacterium]